MPGTVRKFDPYVSLRLNVHWADTAISSRPWRLPTIRCDSLTYIKSDGCVVRPDGARRNVPMFDLTAGPSNNTQLYDHILHAQNSGLPGNPVPNAYFDYPTPLTRIDRGDAQYGKNRSIACPWRMKYYKPNVTPVLSCDEYPMAATREGAAKNNPPVGGRTFSFCSMTTPLSGPAVGPLFPDGDNIANMGTNGWSSCFIPDSQNKSGGGMMPSFYDKNRILAFAEDIDGYTVSAYHA